MAGGMRWWSAAACLALLFAPLVVRAERLMAVTIDDLPFVSVPAEDDAALRALTDGLVGCLRSRRIPAIGFVNEGRLRRDGALDPQRVALLQSWLDAGFELGNHTYSHVSLNRVPFAAFADDVVRGETVTRPLAAAAGRPLRWFRPPFLDLGRTAETRTALQDLLDARGYAMAPVTINSAEWQFADAYARARAAGDIAMADKIGTAYVDYMLAAVAASERLSANLFGRPIRQVLLLHANALNADYLCALAAAIEARNYRFVALETVLEDPAYDRPLPDTEWTGLGWLDRWARGAGLPLPNPVKMPDFVSEWVSPAARKLGRGGQRMPAAAAGAGH